MKNGVKWLTLGAILLCSDATHSQAVAVVGTIVVFQVTNKKFVIAADSRGTINRGDPDDTVCKISALKTHRTIFAFAGVGAVIGAGWDAERAGKLAILSQPTPNAKSFDSYLETVGTAWDQNAITTWDKMMQTDSRATSKIISERGWPLVSAIFATSLNGKIHFSIRSFGFANGNFASEHWDDFQECFKTPCALGRGGLINKNESLVKSYPNVMQRVIKGVEITAAQDKEVGGPIDALTLRNDGTISWYRKKKNCAENSN